MRLELVLLAALLRVSPVLTAPCTALTTLLLRATVTPLCWASNLVSWFMVSRPLVTLNKKQGLKFNEESVADTRT
jgi:hypothetical protein